MTLGDVLRDYREKHDISQRKFATASGISNGYISMLENNLNPKTGLPPAPSLVAMKKAAQVMGMSVNDLIDMVDDIPVDIYEEDDSLDSEAPAIVDNGRNTEFLELFNMLPDTMKLKIISEIKALLSDL